MFQLWLYRIHSKHPIWGLEEALCNALTCVSKPSVVLLIFVANKHKLFRVVEKEIGVYNPGVNGILYPDLLDLFLSSSGT